MAAAFLIFCRKGRIPFEIALFPPNQETREALLEAKKIAASGQKWLPVEEALAKLKGMMVLRENQFKKDYRKA